MSAATNVRMPLLAAVVALAGAALAGLTGTTLSRGNFISRLVARGGGGAADAYYHHPWRVSALLSLLLLALANIKNLPGVWHIRVLRGIIYQLYFQPTPQKPRHLFAPIVTTSFNSLYDCDYNIHKSNSTYFADLDVARAHLVSCIIRTGLARLNRGDRQGLSDDGSGKYFIALGGVACFFHRQIEPLQRFDIFTRVLAWDRKWLYTVSHIVPRRAVKPDSYVLQPWKKGRNTAGEPRGDEEDRLKKSIFATSVARYCFKRGRRTINPETVLERSYLLPPRPAGVSLPPRAEAAEGMTPAETPSEPPTLSSPEAAASEISAKLDTVASSPDVDAAGWTWDDMEAERLRGLKIAAHFDSLGEAQGELKSAEVLGEFGDYW